jgi:hypothetical protein
MILPKELGDMMIIVGTKQSIDGDMHASVWGWVYGCQAKAAKFRLLTKD